MIWSRQSIIRFITPPFSSSVNFIAVSVDQVVVKPAGSLHRRDGLRNRGRDVNDAQRQPQWHAADGFRNPTSLTRWLNALLWLGLVLAIIEALVSLGVAVPGETELATGADALALVSRLNGVESIATTVIFLMWVYRANKNARRLGAVGMKFGPGWAVGWYFIPIANLLVPYLAMREIWKASANPSNWTAQRSGRVLPFWWLLFLVSRLADTFSIMVWQTANTVPLFKGAAGINFLSEMLAAIAIPFAIILVNRICRIQMASRERAQQNIFA
jgi:hypothetical protein